MRDVGPFSLFCYELEELLNLSLVPKRPFDPISVRERDQHFVFPEIATAFINGMSVEESEGVVNGSELV